ncbi:hypothetical protein TSUD_244970 [Trifolium subterraneum]|uniref:Uncharacterized protein n=1 Tax=Trifolium subterraneum TaxID=3900 RepID=A0A2Z6NYQ2_TRISU|nr:hypothetical protein TSUD_244970 [Trifolium subterraneum]
MKVELILAHQTGRLVRCFEASRKMRKTSVKLSDVFGWNGSIWFYFLRFKFAGGCSFQVSKFVSADFGANYTWFLAMFVAANKHKENEALLPGAAPSSILTGGGPCICDAITHSKGMKIALQVI